MPEIMFISVVLPLPFSPKSARISPFFSVRLMSRFAMTEPKLLLICLSSSANCVSTCASLKNVGNNKRRRMYLRRLAFGVLCADLSFMLLNCLRTWS